MSSLLIANQAIEPRAWKSFVLAIAVVLVVFIFSKGVDASYINTTRGDVHSNVRIFQSLAPDPPPPYGSTYVAAAPQAIDDFISCDGHWLDAWCGNGNITDNVGCIECCW